MKTWFHFARINLIGARAPVFGIRRKVLYAVLAVTPFVAANACAANGLPSGSNENSAHSRPFPDQPDLQAASKPIITIGNKVFKDLNANGKVDKYEDWRLPVDQRVDDLVSQMTLEEKAGLMLIDTINAQCQGTLKAPDTSDYINPPARIAA
jgi:beta-glucosidase